ncbi:MAG TPA: DUF6766 family protein [Tepidisphaeraceae bacterium]|jgi:hypothetical protein
MKSFLRNNGLSLTLMALFLVTLVGQAWAGLMDFNSEQREHALATIGMGQYLLSGHFWQAVGENWESEFLQMAMFVVLTIFLFQKGSPESNDPDDPDDPEKLVERSSDPRAPWPVRRGGLIGRMYAHSLSAAFALLFVLSFTIHVVGGHRAYVREQHLNRQPTPDLMEYVASGTFWFESMQNWQSEFLSLAAMVWLSKYLREHKSAESKAVASPHDAHE